MLQLCMLLCHVLQGEICPIQDTLSPAWLLNWPRAAVPYSAVEAFLIKLPPCT